MDTILKVDARNHAEPTYSRGELSPHHALFGGSVIAFHAMCIAGAALQCQLAILDQGIRKNLMLDLPRPAIRQQPH